MSQSTWKWTESLNLDEALIHLEETEGELTRHRLEMIRLMEDQKRLQYRINKLRREAGELK